MKQAYQNLVISKTLEHDVQQIVAVNALSALSEYIVKEQKRKKYLLLLEKVFSYRKKDLPSKGIYFYGRVGRGKTMLMDLFYHSMPIKKKMRIHFHRFMEELHNDLIQFSGLYDPLTHIASKWAKDTDVICFDEFFVTDIADAMLMGGLLDALFERGIILVATSNCSPDELYRNGLQREKFLPTIKLLKEKCLVLSVDGNTDYRRTSSDVNYRNYYFPVKQSKLTERYIDLTRNQPQNGEIEINGRTLRTRGVHNKTIFFDFDALCSGPRSQRDYIYLADNFITIFLDGVPQFAGNRINSVIRGIEDGYQRNAVMNDLHTLDDEARRFIALVDELYDRRIRLIVSADVDIDELYQGAQLRFEFARCQSRLFEMQSWHY